MISLAADENVTVTAGIGGFLAFFFLALALWLLMRNMFARLRRMRYREEARIEGERRAAGQSEAGQSGPGSDGGDGAHSPGGAEVDDADHGESGPPPPDRTP